ncbi:MAG: type II toxin-antitoxin system VapC family toxin [Gammaproteobacteria bacterium]
MIGLDTNVLVRYLAQDDKAQSALATRLIEGSLSQEQPGFIATVVLAELVWVLESNYQVDREKLASLLEALLRTQQLKFEERDAASQALGDFRTGKADYVDCLIQRLAAGAGCSHTVTFDRTASRLDGMRLLGG